jgi:hypothetical protein
MYQNILKDHPTLNKNFARPFEQKFHHCESLFTRASRKKITGHTIKTAGKLPKINEQIQKRNGRRKRDFSSILR